MRTPWLRLALAAGLGVASGACSFVLDFQQCRDDADCANESGEELMCIENECQAPVDPATIPCETTTDCTDRFGIESACGASGACTLLTSEECPTVLMPADATVDTVRLLGSITATSPPYDSVGVPLQNAVQLAVEDFNASARLPGNRRVGWIACNSGGRVQAATAAAAHLQDLGVIGIVGPTTSESLLGIANDVTVGGGTFMMSPTATAAVITGIADEGLVWRVIGSDVHQAFALADRVSLLEPAPSKVVMLTKNDAYGNGILDQVSPILAQRLPAGSLITLKYSDPGAFETNDQLLSEYGARIAIAFGEAPDTIVVIGTSEARDLILFYLEVWADASPRPPLPRFIVTHGGVPVMEEVVESVSESFAPTLMDNVEGISPIVQDEDNFDAFNIRYKIRFDDKDALTISSLPYDAALVQILAASSLGEGPITGAAMAEAMPKLVDKGGTVVSFGGAGLGFISQAVEVLSSGGTVDLKGVSGELDFDVTTGEVRTNLIGWGLQPRPGTTAAPLLTPERLYTLDAPPANGGMWSDL